MSYLDRLREPWYTSPNKHDFGLDIREVTREGGKKVSIHELSGQDKALIQENGQETKPFTLTIFFMGDDYDQPADAFFKALGEPGLGTLGHPRWGQMTVMVITFKQTEGLVEGMRVAIFEVQMVAANVAAWPTSTVNQQANVAAQLGAPAVVPGVVPGSAADLQGVKAVATPSASLIKSLRDLTAGATGWSASIQGYADDVARAMDNVVTDPVALASATINLLSAPGRAASSIMSKVTGYVAVVQQLETSVLTDAQATVAVCQQIGALFGALLATTAGGGPTNRPQAQKITDTVGGLTSTVLGNIEALEAQVPGFSAPIELVLQAKQAARDAIDSVMTAAISLPGERRQTLNAARTPVEFAWEKYGDPERWPDVVDENNLQGRMILEMPIGFEAVWYA